MTGPEDRKTERQKNRQTDGKGEGKKKDRIYNPVPHSEIPPGGIL